MKRRNFLRSAGAIPAFSLTGLGMQSPDNVSAVQSALNNRLKLSLNAYSFNRPLLDEKISLDQLIDFCADHGLFAVDITGYYFKGYPEVPSDDVIYSVKRKAFLKGIEISGTGVRNDFTFADAERRRKEVDHVKDWVGVAAKLGAPALRIFSGNQDPGGRSWEEIAAWVVQDIRECVEYGKQNGVVVYVQNHWDFIKTSEEAIKLVQMVDSEWFGLMLDIGSFRQGDPYAEITRTINYAMSWQIKENVYNKMVQEKVDLIWLFKIIKGSSYRGYLPLETLEGDPFVRVPEFIEQAKEALESI